MKLSVVGYQAPLPVSPPQVGHVEQDASAGVTCWGSREARRMLRAHLRREANRERAPGRVWSWDQRRSR